MTKFLKKNKLVFAGLLIGAIGGYAYYHYIGCSSGSCPLTSNPYVSIGFGAAIGALFLDMFKIKEKNDA